MKLYFTPGVCSLSPHIVASELGLDIDLIKVDLGTKKTADGRDFTKITPKGYVPALELDDGRILTEGPAIVQYLADLYPEKGLVPKCGTFERAKVQEWLNYIGTEIHKNFGPLFFPSSNDEMKNAARAKIIERLALAENTLKETQFLCSDAFCVADAYLFVVLSWLGFVGIEMRQFPALSDYFSRVSARDGVKKALAAEKSA